MRRAPLLAIPLAVIGLVVTAGTAVAKPPLPLDPGPPFDLPGTNVAGDLGYCPFTVHIEYTKAGQHVRTTTLPDGTQVLKVEGGAKIVATNVSNSKSITYNVSGPGTVTAHPSGAFEIDAQGKNLFWTQVRYSLPGQFQLQYSSGPLTVRVAAPVGTNLAGQTLQDTAHNVTNECAALT